MPPRRALIAILILAALCAAGCRRAAPTAPGREVVDGLGHRIVLPAVPRRIVSLAPGVTGSLLALGFGDRLVGVSDFCRLPAGMAPVRRVGGMLNPSLETISALRPDLLIATTSGNDPNLAGQTAALGLPLYTLHTPDIERALRSLADLASVLGDPGRGERLESQLRRRLEAVQERVRGLRPARVLFVVWGEPLLVPGGSSYLTDALSRAGGLSVTADAPSAWPTFDLESAIARRPEVILATMQNRALVERLSRDPAWADVPAVRRGRVHVVSDALQEPGPGIVDGVEEAARLLHPEAFEKGGAPAGRPGRAPGGRPPSGPKKG